jgi:hypothetical protein
MRGAIPLLPPYVLMAWYLVKHRNFTFTTHFNLKMEAAGSSEMLDPTATLYGVTTQKT